MSGSRLQTGLSARWSNANVVVAPAARSWQLSPVAEIAQPELAPAQPSSRSGEQSLARAIEAEIIPRLMLSHGCGGDSESRTSAQRSAEQPKDKAEILAAMSLTEPTEFLIAYLEHLQTQGHAVDALLLDVVGPAARRLGDMWTADTADFTEVTIALNRLRQVVHALGPAFFERQPSRSANRTALLLPCPGEQHSLGLFMVQEFFRRSGWCVHETTLVGVDRTCDLVSRYQFDVVGFSLSCERFLDDLLVAIRAVRGASRNPSVGIMVGGRVFNEAPHLVAEVGADATATDGREAVLALPGLLGRVNKTI